MVLITVFKERLCPGTINRSTHAELKTASSTPQTSRQSKSNEKHPTDNKRSTIQLQESVCTKEDLKPVDHPDIDDHVSGVWPDIFHQGEFLQYEWDDTSAGVGKHSSGGRIRAWIQI
jgi:hypothetical protein